MLKNVQEQLISAIGKKQEKTDNCLGVQCVIFYIEQWRS